MVVDENPVSFSEDTIQNVLSIAECTYQEHHTYVGEMTIDSTINTTTLSEY